MSYKGTLDFQHVLQFDNEGLRVYYGYESNEVFVLPDAIGIAVDPSGKPELTVTLVKAMHAMSPVSLYGTLDLQLALVHPVSKARDVLRAGGYTASVVPASCSGGYLSLVPVTNTSQFPAELQTTLSADWNPVGPTKYLFRLEASSASLMKESLKNGSLLFRAMAVLECKGLAPRLPLLIRFSPAELLAGLQANVADSKGAIDPDALKMFFNRDASLLPLTITGDRKDEIPGVFAEAFSDRVFARFTKPAPPSQSSDKDLYELTTNSAEIGTGIVEWDLSELVEVKRLLRLSMNPVEAARFINSQPGGSDSSIRETLVPTLQTGFKCLNVSAILPAYRPNVIRAAVQIDAPARVPLRMQAISETVNLNPPMDASDIVLRYSPAETFTYNYRPFMLVKGIGGVKKIQGDAGIANNSRLVLNTDHFKVQFVTIKAASDLLEIATLLVSFDDEHGGSSMEYKVDKSQPLLSVCFPADEPLPSKMSISAISLATGAVVVIPAQPAKSMRVGLHHFKEYGYHPVKVFCNFSNGLKLVKIELQPEEPTDSQPTLMFFTPAKNSNEFGYFTDSPFNCTYKYRFKKDDGTHSGWFSMQSPWVPLLLDDALM